MATFKKDNKVITASDTSEAYYLSEGYDKVDVDPKTKQYTIVKPSVRKTVPYADYAKLQAELDALKAKK